MIRFSIGAQRLASGLIAGAVLLSLAASAVTRRGKDPAAGLAGRHRGVVRAGRHRAPDCDGICLQRRRRPGPIRQVRRREPGRRPARRGLRRSRFQDLSRTPRAPRHRTELLLDPRLLPRLAPHAQGQQGRSLRPPATGADLAAFRRHRRRAHSRAGALRVAPRHHQPDLAGEPQIPGIGLRRSSLWQAGQRHARQRAEDRRRRHEGLRPPRDRQGYLAHRRGRRCRRRHARQAAGQDLRRHCRPRPA